MTAAESRADHRQALIAAAIPKLPCAHCGSPWWEPTGKVVDRRRWCVPCAACSLKTCAAWAVRPGGLCPAHELAAA